jgi:hypothetical protein
LPIFFFKTKFREKSRVGRYPLDSARKRAHLTWPRFWRLFERGTLFRKMQPRKDGWFQQAKPIWRVDPEVSSLLPLISMAKSRATRFGEFSHFGRFFTLERSLEIRDISQKLGPSVFHCASSVLFIVTKNGLGYILGHFLQTRLWSMLWSQFSAIFLLAFFSKINVMITFLQKKTSSGLSKKPANIFAKFLSENILKS